MTRGVAFLACVAAALAASAGPAFGGPLRTAITDPGAFEGPNQVQAFARTRATGATMARIHLFWRNIAPPARPASFNPTNPDDPAYNWTAFDGEVRAAVAAGLEPVVVVMYAPSWAERPGNGSAGTVRPDPVEFGNFARAAARRYSGNHYPSDPYAEALPRVRYWMAWNEPNRGYFLAPQFQSGRMVSAGWYRQMVNRFTPAVRSAHANNVVIAGGLAPLGRPGHAAPLPFMRNFLSAPVQFDVWSHHPYTSGGPTHKAASSGSVALGNLPQMRKVLNSFIRNGRIRSNQRVQFWVTEFSWDTSPPDPRALGTNLHARWTSEALFRMWQNGVSVVTWFKLQDDPLRASPYQSGFYTVSGARKRSFTAFRFPTVAFTRPAGVYVWGRTPTSKGGTVVLEVKTGKSWRRLGTVRANGHGIFQKTYRTPVRKGHVRARFQGEVSLPFSLTPVRNRHVNPFGCGGGIPC